jgi:uncharacterized protein
MVRRILIAGISARSAADSAAGAGFSVTAIDAFGDLDQHASVRSISLGRRFTPRTAAQAARGIGGDAAVYLSSFENHPAAIAALAAGRMLWGNGADIVRRVRNPRELAAALQRQGLAAPDVRVRDAHPAKPGVEYLVKPLFSGGGHGIRPWDSRQPIPRGCYLQERLEGVSGSVVFVAAAGRAVPFGISRQLVGDAAFGASAFQYCGNIIAARDDPQFERGEALARAACALAQAAAGEFGLVGVNGIDFISRHGVPAAVEVNPRWCASMELAERASGLSAFAAHAAACAPGALPPFDLLEAPPVRPAIGKAVVFARRDVIVGNTRAWLDERDEAGGRTIRDIPHKGDAIPAGRPVCTVFATGADGAACYAALVRRAERVYADLDATSSRLAPRAPSGA